MITALIFLAVQQPPIGFLSYVERHNLPILELDDIRGNERDYKGQRLDPPMRLLFEANDIENKEACFAGFDRVRENSQRPSGFDSLPRKLSDGTILGFSMTLSRNRAWKEHTICAFGNHSYIIVTVAGVLMPTGRPGEAKELEPTPQNTEKLASDIATLFFAEQEAYHFRTSDLRQNGNYFLTLVGLDNSIYLSLNSYGKSVSATFTLDPDTGAGKINSNPPMTFNLGSRHYKVGDQEKTAEHIVVLKDGEAYLPQEMLPK